MVGRGFAKESAAAQWIPLPDPGLSVGGGSASSVWTGSDLLVWGGSVGNPPVSTSAGAQYDPAAMQWIAMQAAGGPSLPYGATTAWTGREMVVLGGVGAESEGRYSPETDTWAPVSQQGALHTAHGVSVWTGDAVLVWGGVDTASTRGAVAEGAAYSPATDTWRALSVDGAPERRYDAASVWTGSEMIVWGGNENGGAFGTAVPLADGGIYVPATDTWEALPATPILRVRYGASSVWTGREMVIWGGEDNRGALGDGAAYDPASGAWRPIAVTGAPSPRFGASVVWTGQQVLVWGGCDQAGALGDGAAYNPGTDQWTPLPSQGAPTARCDATTAWTGTEMLVWGGVLPAVVGTPFETPLEDGAAYVPPCFSVPSASACSK